MKNILDGLRSLPEKIRAVSKFASIFLIIVKTLEFLADQIESLFPAPKTRPDNEKSE